MMKTNRASHPALRAAHRFRATAPWRDWPNLIGALCAPILLATTSAGATPDPLPVVSAFASADDGNGLVSQVQTSADLVNWADLGAPITNTATLLTQQTTSPRPHCRTGFAGSS